MSRPSLTQDAFLASLLACVAVGAGGCSRAEPAATREPASTPAAVAAPSAAIAPAQAAPAAKGPASTADTTKDEANKEEAKKDAPKPSMPAATATAANAPGGIGRAQVREVAGPAADAGVVPGRTKAGSASCGAGNCSSDMKKPR